MQQSYKSHVLLEHATVLQKSCVVGIFVGIWAGQTENALVSTSMIVIGKY